MAHEVLEAFMVGDDRMRLVASITGYPAWAVEVEAFVDGPSVSLAELRFYPRQRMIYDGDALVWSPGSTPAGRVDEVDGTRGWSGATVDVPAGGIPARLLRSTNAGELLALAQACARDEQDIEADRAARWSDRSPSFAAHFERRSAMAAALSGAIRQRAGRKGNGVEHYLAWAVRYAAKVEAGVRNPIAELARESGESVVYVRDTVTDARRRHGLLTPRPGRGRAGGRLTAKALALLEDAMPGTETEGR